MRLLLPLMIAAVLLPAGASAQRKPVDLGAIRAAPPASLISEKQATATALARVRSELTRGGLSAWGGATGGGIRPASVAAEHTLFNPTGGHSGNGVYVVEVTAPKTPGHVRVVINAQTGAVTSIKLSPGKWATSAEWWKRGESGPPAK